MQVRIASNKRRFGNPLFLLAGLPRPIDEFVRNGLENDRHLPRADYISVAFPNDDRPGHEAAQRLLSLASERIQIVPKGDILWVTPSKIILLFARNESDEALRINFSFFAFPVGIDLNYSTSKGVPKSGRRNPGFALQVFRRTILNILSNEGDLFGVERWIAFKYKITPLLLPAKNFVEPDRRRPLERFFTELWEGKALWKRANGHLSLSQFKAEDFPHLPMKRKRLSAFSDGRALAFLPAPVELWHAPARPLTQERSLGTIRTKFNELYRFGIPIHDGFHFDVQKRGNKSLKAIRFECAVNGRVKVAGTHVNIYPNDYLRP